MKPVKNWLQLGVLIGITLLGTAMFAVGLRVETYESPQIDYYNRALALYEKAQRDPKVLDEAILNFDKSLDEYHAMENPDFVQKTLYPPRSSEIAALALSKKAVLLLLKQKPEDAVRAFRESISINPGSLHADLIAQTMPGENLSANDVARLADQAYVTIHNLEMLFGKSPKLQQEAGMAEGKKKKPKPEQAPGDKPAPGAGKSGDPNAI